uniref:Protein of unassigned function n=2 Tax=Methylobacterium oryzae TaxID=334852 RepID=A0A088B2Z3_9HYPH|nr:protein of unassigned function [Methylobacterium oryzae CBMB20]
MIGDRSVTALLDTLEAVSKILLIIGTLVGGGWAVYEYLEKKQDVRIAESIGYVKRFSSEPLIGAQNRIGQAWYAARSQLQILAATPVASSEEFAKRKRQLVMSVVEASPVSLGSGKQRGIVSDADLIVGFFDELHICMTSNLCDKKIAQGFFRPYVERFYCLHEPFLVWKSKNYSAGYADSMRKDFAPPSGCSS